jgi:ribonuclease PH
MTESGRFLEVQGTAEGMSFSREELDELLGLAETGIRELMTLQKLMIADAPAPRSAGR